jgi:hypothetical protein
MPSFGSDRKNNNTPSWSTNDTSSQPVPIQSPTLSMNAGGSTSMGMTNTGMHTSMNGNSNIASSPFLGTTNSTSFSSSSKPSISFPKTSITTNFSPAGGAGTHSNSGTPTFGQRNMNSNNNFGFNNTPNNSIFSTNPNPLNARNSFPSSGTTPTSTSFQSPSLGNHMNRFQPNPLLSRPSPSSSSSPIPSFMNQQNQQSDLASSSGLRRRTTAGTALPRGTNRPPIPNMTRLGESIDTTNDFNGNLKGKARKDNLIENPVANILKTQKENQPPQSIIPKAFSATNYNSWVIIYGFSNELEYNTILTNFEGYGTMTDKYPSTSSNGNSKSGIRSGSNWVCVKYDSSLQADKALCQNGSLVHVVGNVSHGKSPSGETSNSMQDDIVIVGVMQMDESVAMKLGLKNYLEMGSTGFERIGNSGKQEQGLYQNAPSTNDGMKQKNARSADTKQKNARFASSVMDEDDILLLGDDSRRRNGAHGSQGEELAGRGNGPCEKMLSWYFSW